jgi:hypothetical protein
MLELNSCSASTHYGNTKASKLVDSTRPTLLLSRLLAGPGRAYMAKPDRGTDVTFRRPSFYLASTSCSAADSSGMQQNLIRGHLDHLEWLPSCFPTTDLMVMPEPTV